MLCQKLSFWEKLKRSLVQLLLVLWLEQLFEQSFDNLSEQLLKGSIAMIHLYRCTCRLLSYLCICYLVGLVVQTLKLLSACCRALWAKFSIFSTYIYICRKYTTKYKNKLIWANLMLMTSNEHELEWYP